MIPKKASVSCPLENVEATRFAREVRRFEAVWPELLNLTPFPAQGGAGGKSRGARMASEGLRAGYPDILLDWPAQGFHGLRIELKRQRFTPSDIKPNQRAWHDRLRAAGFRVEVCGGWAEAWAVLVEYLGK